MRLLALLHFRDEAGALPGYFANIAPQVDGIVALDHGSIDGASELAGGEPKLVELLRRPRDAPFDQGLQQRLLTQAGIRNGADWLLGLDADERLERSAGGRIRARIAEDGQRGSDAYALPICELWDRLDAFRVDGLWGQKARTTLFRASEDHRFDDRRFHAQWGSVRRPPFGRHPRINARIYHLGTLSRKDRFERQARWRELDPDCRWQQIGYDYLTDETGLKVERIEPGRGYEDVIGRERWGAEALRTAAFEERGDLRRMIVHHTAVRNPALEHDDLAAESAYMRGIEQLHLDRGWSAVGYHFVIMPSGRVFEGRPLWALGAHVEGHNHGTMGIALAGNFEEESPTSAAVQSLQALAQRLTPGGSALTLLPHGDLMETACPGRFLREALPTETRVEDLAAGR
jgi:N-acetylmuramoyl-L-alanine amidase